MKKLLPVFLLLLPGAAAFAQPNWADNIACIVYSHCTGCHNPNGLAPFSLTTYNNAYIYRASIEHAVEHGEMPPHPADVNYRTYAHSNTLSENEVDQIIAWVKAGAPEGNASNAPAPPVYTNQAKITDPDTTVRIPTYTIPTLSDDLYRAFVVSQPSGAVRFVTGIEVIPGNLSAVHHVLVFADSSQIPVQLDAADAGPGYTSFGGIGSNTAKLLGAWVPGNAPYFFKYNMGMPIIKGSRIIIQIHYPAGSSGKIDSTKVNFIFDTTLTLRPVTAEAALNHTTNLVNGPLVIPADSIRTFHEQITVPYNATILSVTPHAHLICKSMYAFGIKPGGDTIPIIKIDHWDFHWQMTYTFPKPVRLPVGTVLHGYATYDNTSSNPENPSSPPKTVYLGESTTDEMMLFYFHYLLYQAGDENLVIDSSSHFSHYQGCETTWEGLAGTGNGATFALYPNPAAGTVTIETGTDRPVQVMITGITGQQVFVTLAEEQVKTIPLAGLHKGVYFVTLVYPGGERLVKKLLVQ